jgi:perosamine synthetase
LNVDPAHMASMITERTKAMVVVHYGGMPVSVVNHLLTFAPGRHIPLIEDCAQSLGSRAGQFGDFACYSFQAVKHLTTGDGGMLAINDEDLVSKAKRLRWFGIDRAAKLAGTWANDITEIGFKSQMTDISAAMGLAGLEELDMQIELRRQARSEYTRLLAGVDGIKILDIDPDSACWLMTVLVERREDLRRKLKDANIESDQVHYRNDRYSIFKEFRGEFPNMDAIESKYLCLPLHAHLTVGDVERVCEVIKSGW